jgi:ATP-binding cassette, subfamily B, bacterial
MMKDARRAHADERGPSAWSVLSCVAATTQLVWRASKGLSLALAALTVSGALFPVFAAYAGKRIVDAVVAGDVGAAVRWVLVELAFVSAVTLTQRGLSFVHAVLGARLGIEVNLAIMKQSVGLELHHFESSVFYDQLTRARREAATRPLQLAANVFGLLQYALSLVGYVALLFRFSPLAALGLLVATIPAALVEIRYAARTYGLRNVQSTATRQLDYLQHVLTNDEHAKEVKLLGIGPLFMDRYRGTAEDLYRAERSLSLRHTLVTQGATLLGSAAFYAVYAVIALTAALGRLTLGNMTMYVMAFREAQQSFRNALATLAFVYEHSLYMSNLFRFLAVRPRRRAPAAAPPTSPPTRARGIEFVDVGFRYPSTGRWALRHLDLRLESGKSLALVGANGAGKSTLVKLLTGLYEPSEGRILLDGRDLASWDEGALHARLGVVFQDFNQFQLTLRENVALGSVDHRTDEGRIRRALARSGAAELASRLADGLDAQLGGWFDGGAELSGGQWQRVALARAFMREEADILVLDEPTATLDAEAEHALFERFQELARGRTTLLISHRFATVRTADRIVVLEQGRVLEDGSHDELMGSGGAYARLFALQAEAYR